MFPDHLPLTAHHKMIEKFTCPVCNREVDDNIIPYHKKVEQQILEVIQKMVPRWYDGDNNKKCIDYYRALIVNKTIK